MRKTQKLTDKQFWTILRKCAGLYARAARMIEKEFNVPYSRQAVKDRAEKDLQMLADINEENLDIAEEGLHDLMRSGIPQVKLKAIELYLKTKGKKRGYVEKQEVDLNVSKIEVEFI